LKAISTVAKREFRACFDSPLGYVLVCFALVLLGAAFFFLDGGFWQTDRASLDKMMVYAPRGLSFLVVPALTMGVLAAEKRSGTLEILSTLPVTDHQIVLGKFFGALAVVGVLIASTLLFPVLMFRWPWHLGQLDLGPVAAGYVGVVLYAAAAIAIGLLVSALTESQFIAFIVTSAILLVLHGVGWAAEQAPSGVARTAMAFVGFDSRLAPFTRGLIDTRDVIYFLSITVGCLVAAESALARRRTA
jgi:ABC-2 type transport system permease protein